MEMFLRIEPDSCKLTGNLKMNNPADSVFRLSKGMEILSMENSAGRIQFSVLPASDNSFSNKYIIHHIPEELTIQFSGQIRVDDFPKNISNLNIVCPALVELSDLIIWYPKTVKDSPAIYRLVIDLPDDFVSVTNCTKTDEVKIHQRVQTNWISDSPKYNITLLAAPGLKKSVRTDNSKSIDIYFHQLPVSYIDSMKSDLMKTWNFYEKLYGTKGAADRVKIVYSPRPAGGYTRAPLIVVSERFALEQLSTTNSYVRDFRLNAHEIAHYWSRANTTTPDDWLNEGLAEFSALLASEFCIGKAFYTILVKEYRDMAEGTPTRVSVLETTADSREREINRYYKPTLLLNDLRMKYGDDLLIGFFHVLYQRFEEEKTATTAIFLDALKNVYGKDEADSFLNALSEKNPLNQPETLNSTDLDSAIMGIWTGKLTQFGATSQFVMNVKIADGQVVATLDSPDQNAFDIPVSEFQFNKDSIFFRVGIAGATYSGKLERTDYTIKGIWKQRNNDYPLNILRQEDK